MDLTADSDVDLGSLHRRRQRDHATALLGGLRHSRAGALHLFAPARRRQRLTWVLSIMFLTVVIRIALIPLFVKQIKSSRNHAAAAAQGPRAAEKAWS